MRKTKLLGWLLFVCLVFSIASIFSPFVGAEAPWLDGWGERELFYYQSSTSTTNYQGSLIVINQTGFNGANTFYIYNETLASFEDLRVTQSDGTTILPIWNQTTNSGLNCTFWAKFPVVNASYFLYWNNPDAVSVWNQTAVFVDIISGVLGAWAMDEINVTAPVTDYSGNGHSGTVTGTTLVSGKFSGTLAKQTNSSTDQVSFGNLGTLPVVGSLEFWFKGTATNYGNLFRTIASTTVGFRVQVYASGQFNGYGDAANVILASGFQNDYWYHLVFNWNTTAKTLTVWLDNTKKIDAAIQATMNTAISSFVVGTGYDDSSGRRWVGVISNINYYNSSLTVSQIGNLFGNYPDVRLVAGSVFVRNYVYPSPGVSLFGVVESAPEPTPSPSPTIDPNALTVDDGVALAVVFGVIAISLAIIFPLYFKKRKDS